MGRRLTDEERAYRAFSEKEVQRQITDAALMYGWHFRHFHDSRRQVTRKGGKSLMIGDADAKGWPDLVIVRPPELVVVEVKAELGDTTDEQVEWLGYLSGCGVETFVSRPSNLHLPDGILTRLRQPRPRGV